MIRPCPACDQMRGIDTYTNSYGETEVDYWQCDCRPDPPGDPEPPDYSDHQSSADWNDQQEELHEHRR